MWILHGRVNNILVSAIQQQHMFLVLEEYVTVAQSHKKRDTKYSDALNCCLKQHFIWPGQIRGLPSALGPCYGIDAKSRISHLHCPSFPERMKYWRDLWRFSRLTQIVVDFILSGWWRRNVSWPPLFYYKVISRVFWDEIRGCQFALKMNKIQIGILGEDSFKLQISFPLKWTF